jgi:glycosyltransferase involved in cell wall biosynthesis
MYKNFTIEIPTYNSSTYVDELLASTIDLIHLNEVIIVDDKSTPEEFNELIATVGKEKYKNLNIKISQNEVNLGGFRNKRKGVITSIVAKQVSGILIWCDAGNILKKELNLIKKIVTKKKFFHQ